LDVFYSLEAISMVRALCFSIVHAKGFHEEVMLTNWIASLCRLCLTIFQSGDIIYMDYAGAFVVREVKKLLMECHR
jgi:hypothetical protein